MQEWIAVYEGVLGGKLRGLRKSIGCSDAEALGILCYLWFWARNNTDETGLLENVEIEDIEDALSTHIGKDYEASDVVKALVETGWIDSDGKTCTVHNWGKWQAFWYKSEKRREKDRERKRTDKPPDAEQEEQKEAPKPEKTPEIIIDIPAGVPTVGSKKPKAESKKAEEQPKMTFYGAEFVKLKQSECDELLSRFGEEFVKKCIETLDNYKGSKGTTYKSDYRAILSWVVDKVAKEHQNIPKKPSQGDTGGRNPFEEFA